MIEFDAKKDRINLDKHGISLSRALDLEVMVRVIDERYAEPRLRAYGTIDGLYYCLAYVMRDGILRPISLRRTHLKEVRRHVRQA